MLPFHQIIHITPQPLRHLGLKQILEAQFGFRDVIFHSDLGKAWGLLSTRREALFILHIYTDEWAEQISIRYNKLGGLPPAIVLVLEPNTVCEPLMKLPVAGLLSSTCGENEWVPAIQDISSGKRYCAPEIAVKLLEYQYDKRLAHKSKNNLTARETEIIRCIARGMQNDAIAEELGISPHTVQTHRKRIMKKLGVRSSSELVLHAVNKGLHKP